MNKPFKTVDEQIAILESRNIIVTRKKFARQVLPLIFKQNVSGGAGFVTVMSSFDYIIDLPDMQL